VRLSNRKFKFYNAGDRIQQTLRFSNPNGHDIHCICHFHLDAPAGRVFTVPEMIDVQGAEVHVHFVDDIVRDFGSRGVILIDSAFEPPLRYNEEGQQTKEIDEEQWAKMPVARSEEEAKAKGQLIWREYIDVAVRAYLDQCEHIRAAGGMPIAASGWVKHALKLAGIVDPAEAMLIEARRQTTAMDRMTDTIEKQQRQIDQLLEAQRASEKTKQQQPQPVGANGR
jgi:hypothetical protein